MRFSPNLLDIYDHYMRSNLGEIKPDFVIEKFPGLVITSITPFGYFGPYAGLLANDDVLEAMSQFVLFVGG